MTQVQKLARFIVATTYHDLSKAARQRLKLHILDSLGCAIGALSHDLPGKVRAAIDELGGSPQCTLIGGGQTSVDRAAQHNTALLRYLDFMDNFMATGETCHPSD